MKRYALLALAAGLLVAAAPDDAKNDLKKLDGTWVLASGENDGKKISADTLKTGQLTIDGDKHTVKVGDTTYKGTHKLDPTAKPKTIDITPTNGDNKGKTSLGIYDLDGDTLKICWAPAGKDRPTEFKSADGSGVFLAVHKKAKE